MEIFIGIAMVLAIVLCFIPKAKCPECEGELKHDFFDSENQFVVYKCEMCGKQYK